MLRTTAEVRYVPADPDQFVVSWGIELTAGRARAVVFFLVFGVFCLLGGVGGALRHSEKAFDTTAR
jgi:hypothetical protein